MASQSQPEGADGNAKYLEPISKKELAALRKVARKATSGSVGDMLVTLENECFFATATKYRHEEKVVGLVVELSQKTLKYPDLRLNILASGGFLDGLYGENPREFMNGVRRALYEKKAPIPERHVMRDALSAATLVFFGKVLEHKSIPKPKAYICATAAHIAIKASQRPEASCEDEYPNKPDALAQKTTDYCSEQFIRQTFGSLYFMLMAQAPMIGRSERVIRLAELILSCARDGIMPTADELAAELGMRRKLVQSYLSRVVRYFKKLKEPVLEWCQREAFEGRVNAQFVIASLYYFGWGVTQDCVEAILWLRVAANGGHSGAQYQLWLQHAEGAGGVPTDPDKGMRWLRLAAAQGHAEAREDLKQQEGRARQAKAAPSPVPGCRANATTSGGYTQNARHERI